MKLKNALTIIVTLVSLVGAGMSSAQYDDDDYEDEERGRRGGRPQYDDDYERGGRGGRPQTYTEQEAEEACLDGDQAVCRELYRYANGRCNQGDRRACRYAEQVGQHIGRGYQPPPRSRGPRYPGDPIPPKDQPTIEGTKGYINSKCDDPNMAAQLQAWGFCKGR